ncbi:nuclear transport factor 2 family protein [Streptomyces phyllanthi]|uniref:Nuclear transport factor 2 family protein n=1 Tax=Streptomyces phyllanthi TaxID=1803180 RepID=A0A5N8W2Q3_9ACTN|nr:nuclear transport factor 2 family protein [Streptomyces phyllanthi]MPY41402.1 nuclear transport factor 2 family protein [Streptomyces phyllanthi]
MTYTETKPGRGDTRPTAGRQSVQDRLDLRQLVDAYALAVDRRLPDLFASLFSDDGQLVVRDTDRPYRKPLVLDGRDGWTKAFAVLAPCVLTTHFVGNHLVRLSGDRATGETYCLAHEIYPGGEAGRLLVRSVRYRDSYCRTDGRWRFSRRELTVDWVEERVLRSLNHSPDRA